MTERMDKNEKEILTLTTRFNAFESHVNAKFEEVLESLKPRYTDKQIIGFICSTVGIMVGIMIYVEGIKSNTRVNALEIRHYKETQRLELSKFNEIIKIVNGIKTDVAVLKDHEESKDN